MGGLAVRNREPEVTYPCHSRASGNPDSHALRASATRAWAWHFMGLEKPVRQVRKHDGAKAGNRDAEHMVDVAHDASVDVAMKDADNCGHREPPERRAPDN